MLIQTEVSFINLYKDQPSFGAIDAKLRELGFVPHMFASLNQRMFLPMIGPNPYQGLNQVMEADIVYVRDFTRPELMSNEQLKQLALLAHYIYNSYDIDLNCIHHLVERGALSITANDYLEIVQRGPF